jgi:RNA-splicing ligase RtcB
MITLQGKYCKATIHSGAVDNKILSVVTAYTNHPAFTYPIVVMPDVQYGGDMKSMVGFTMPMGPKIVPNIVGGDLSCGVSAINIGPVERFKIDLKELDLRIRDAVPFGQRVHDKPIVKYSDFDQKGVKDFCRQFTMKYNTKFEHSLAIPKYDEDWVDKKCVEIGMSKARMLASIGTLGGGNHFIELGISQKNQELWIIVHSGSRQLGQKVCKFHQKRAVKHKEKFQDNYKTELKRLKTRCKNVKEIPGKIRELKDKLRVSLPKGLEYLEAADAISYCHDSLFAQYYARINRHTILEKIRELIAGDLDVTKTSLDTVHNYVDFSDFVIRKGAISANKNMPVIIPMNSKFGCIIGMGRSNHEWNNSAPHGAGRDFGRTDAKENLTMDQYEKDMDGVYSTSVVPNTLDESPAAYKDPDTILEMIKPTIHILDTVKAIYNAKDSGPARVIKDKKET